jgi:DNA-binding CsgD family transcriptional regulator
VDPRAHDALRNLVRSTIASDLDELAAELTRVRRELRTIERLVGLPSEPAGVSERRARVLALAEAGHSGRAIAHVLGIGRATVSTDLRALGAPPPPAVLGRDGRVTHPRRANGSRAR